MDFQAISSVVSKLAPQLGQAISLVNPMAGIAVSLISQVFGSKPTDSNDLIQKISQDPDAEIKLKQIEFEYKETLLKYQSSDFNKSMDDVSNARNREIELQKISGKHDYMLPLLGLSSIALFSMVIIIVLFTKMDASDHDVLYMMIGQLISLVLMVYGFYFGNSQHQAKK